MLRCPSLARDASSKRKRVSQARFPAAKHLLRSSAIVAPPPAADCFCDAMHSCQASALGSVAVGMSGMASIQRRSCNSLREIARNALQSLSRGTLRCLCVSSVRN